MADIADVEAALVAAIENAVYPNGTGASSAITLTGGGNPSCRIYSGWPIQAKLDADQTSGNPPGSAAVINISVFTEYGMERNTTRYPQEWKDQVRNTSTIVATVVGNTVELTASSIDVFGRDVLNVGDYASIILGQQASSVALGAGDTLTTLAANLAAGFTAPVVAISSGKSVIFVSGAPEITARTASPGTVIRELGRSNQRFRITIWANKNDARVATARVVRPALEAINFLNLADGSSGRLIYESSGDDPSPAKDNIARRDLCFWVEYPTTQTAPGYPITVPQVQINTADGTPNGSTYLVNS